MLVRTVRSVGGRGIVIIKLPFYSASSGPCNLIRSGQSDRSLLPAMGGQIEISTPVLDTLGTLDTALQAIYMVSYVLTFIAAISSPEQLL